MNNTTELVFIIDKSGSMAGMEKDTIGGFNAMIEKQKQQEGKVYVTTAFFSNDSEIIHDRLDLNDIKPLTENDYQVGGCTALLDAIGGAISHITNIHKYIRKEDVPEHTIFLITTDGMENASNNYTRERVKELIKNREENKGWEFIFVAANIDAVETAENIGIRRDRAVDYCCDEIGTATMYECMSDAVKCVRSSEKLSENWSEKIKKDNKRKK